MLTIVIGIVKKSPGLIINRNVTTYDEYHPGLFQMLLEFWQGLYSSYRCILFFKSVEQSLFEKIIVVKMVKKCYSFSGLWRFSVVVTRVCHLILYKTWWVHSFNSYRPFFKNKLNIYLSNWPTWCTKFYFTISLFHASTCFEHHVLIIWRSKSLVSSHL